jgi:hypothetical protein
MDLNCNNEGVPPNDNCLEGWHILEAPEERIIEDPYGNQLPNLDEFGMDPVDESYPNLVEPNPEEVELFADYPRDQQDMVVNSEDCVELFSVERRPAESSLDAEFRSEARLVKKEVDVTSLPPSVAPVFKGYVWFATYPAFHHWMIRQSGVNYSPALLEIAPSHYFESVVTRFTRRGIHVDISPFSDPCRFGRESSTINFALREMFKDDCSWVPQVYTPTERQLAVCTGMLLIGHIRQSTLDGFVQYYLFDEKDPLLGRIPLSQPVREQAWKFFRRLWKSRFFRIDRKYFLEVGSELEYVLYGLIKSRYKFGRDVQTLGIFASSLVVGESKKIYNAMVSKMSLASLDQQSLLSAGSLYHHNNLEMKFIPGQSDGNSTGFHTDPFSRMTLEDMLKTWSDVYDEFVYMTPALKYLYFHELNVNYACIEGQSLVKILLYFLIANIRGRNGLHITQFEHRQRAMPLIWDRMKVHNFLDQWYVDYQELMSSTEEVDSSDDHLAFDLSYLQFLEEMPDLV